MSLTDEIDAFRHRAFRGLSSEADIIDKLTSYVRRSEALRAEGMAELAQFFNGGVGFGETSLSQEWPDPNGDLPPPPAVQNGNGGYGYHPPPPPPGYVPHPNGGIPPDQANGEWPAVIQRAQPPQYPARRFK